jgi:adenylate cyclase
VVLARFIDEGGFSIAESDPMFKAVAAGEGWINAVKDVDGSMRSVPLTMIEDASGWRFALSLASVLVADNIPPEEVHLGTGRRAGKYPLPKDLTLRINFIGGPRSVRYIPLYRFFPDKIDGRARKKMIADKRPVLPPVKPEELRNRIILVGDTTKDGQDFIRTPVSRYREEIEGEVDLEQSERGTLMEMPGVEVHAHAVFNLLHDTWLRGTPKGSTLLVCALLGLVSLIFYGSRTGFLLAGTIFLVKALVLLVTTYAVFLNAYTVFPVVPVLAVVAFNFVGGVAYQGILQQRKKQAVTSMFGKYVSDNLVKKMVSGDLKIDTEGRTKELSILFSDIRGFTRLSEGLEPAVVSRILHDYFSRMIRTIFHHGGTLDKLMGDAIMAFFGDPEDLPGHPKKAADAALAMLVALESWKAASDLPAVKGFGIGIGLNTGVVTVGNLGSDEYFDYTVIGDNVNLGSRLEGLNKAYRTSIILSETTFREIEDEFECRRLGKVTVVGKSKPVEIFELLGRKGETPAGLCDARTRFEEGLAMWEKGEFSEAAQVFRDAVDAFDDGPSRVFLDLSESYAKEPPEEFQGVFIPKGK